MFRHFFNFEVRFWLRGWMVWIFFLVVTLLFFGAVSSDHVVVGNTLGNTNKNAPWVIENFYAVCSILTLLMTTAFVNAAASREFAYNTSQIVFATPIKKFEYLAGRFLGSALVAVIPLLGVSAGILAGKYMPWIDPERWGPVIWSAHLKAILVFAIPNTLFIAAIIFAIAVLSRSTVVSFVGGLVLLVGYGIAQALTTDLQNQTLAALVDPFATNTFQIATKYWTVADKNNLTLGYSGLLLWNRLIWLGVGLLVFAFACTRFSFAERSKKTKPGLAAAEATAQATVLAPPARREFGAAAQWAQFTGSARLEFRRLIKTIPFVVIAAAALLNCLTSLIFNSTEIYGNVSFPVTYQMLEIIAGTLYIFLIALLTYHAGVLIWEERDSNNDEVQDALPVPEWPAFAAKFVALMASIAIILAVTMVTAVLVQYFHHFHRYQFGLYISTLFGIDFSAFIFLAILAFFIHVLSPNKYVGYFAFIAFVIANAFIWRPLNIATNLVKFGQTPDMVYSDFYGFAPFLKGWTWFTLYWAAFSLMMIVATLLLWPRGRDRRWSSRLRNARLRFHRPLRALAAFGMIAFLSIGAWIYYNTEIVNKLRSEDDQDALQADYEKSYKKFEKQPEPRITDVKYDIDIFPQTRGMEMRGAQTIVNKTSQPLREVDFTLTNNYDTQIEVPGAKLTNNDTRLLFQTFSLDPPMQPGESRVMHFTVKARNRGFENSVTNREIVQNGTFFNSTVAPAIGYQPGNELTDRNKRKKWGLKEKDLMPALEENCTTDCMNSYLSNNSDWVNVETVISTSADQIAIAPGSLLGEWSANGRHYYHYKLDHYSLNFYSFMSATYQVARSNWNGISIEVYYLKEHPWNVPKMLNSVKKSFDYYTRNFGPYPHREARIIEFPRIARFAQAFPGTMPYSESIGFIANLEHPDDIDFVFYVVGHEMAHQWWAHQVIGANMQGATLLSETLAQYSALMIMEKEYGPNAMRKFMQYEMDNYLRSRGTELLKERPLLRVEDSQGYIHYRKGSVVMYYLRDMIGEDAVNRALRKLLGEYGYKDPPYPTSYALMDALREQMPPDRQYLLKELFYDITLFSNGCRTATAHKRSDGKYDVTVEVETHKYKADEKGNETEVPADDWIEIGALAAPQKGKKYGEVLHRERVHMTTGKSTYTFTTDTLPDKAGIDPRLLLIDRVPDDNLTKVTLQ
ncbi:MAG TPA: M1 family aminopeptidase [Terriglobales bacterium]|nr:M1 family aminopeptidase [Terriglobales bacterium]